VGILGEAEYIVSKNRNEGLVRNRMRCEKEYALFTDLEEFNHHASSQFPISNLNGIEDFEPEHNDNQPF